MSSWPAGQSRLQTPAPTRLLCLPYAGSGASVYRSWRGAIPGIEVVPVQLPGREERRKEDAHRELRELIECLVWSLDGQLEPPFALFGHSLGGLIAFELARALRDEFGVEPTHLFVSGVPAPHLPLGRAPLHDKSDEALIHYLASMKGTPQQLFANRWLLDLYLPVLRADLALFETYTHLPEAALSCPITAFAGDADPIVHQERIAPWEQHTSSDFDMVTMAGGHFFLRDQEAALHQHIMAALACTTEEPRQRWRWEPELTRS